VRLKPLSDKRRDKKLRRFARSLRKSSTETEKLLWGRIRNRQLGVKFKRQEPIGEYVVDFVCYEKKVIIELDGGQHMESTKDAERDRSFAANGCRVLRFWDSDIWKNREGVIQVIMREIGEPR
jgi:very-short-patch-repair endonuclease